MSEAEPPVENPVDSEMLAAEAELAKETTGEKTTGAVEGLPSIEFYYGKVKQDGRWIKTGKIYWIYTTYRASKRKRVSPSKIYRREKNITSISKCPYQGRILDFYSRSLTFRNTGGASGDGRLQGNQEPNAEVLASQ
jgi:hypothetical protein